MSNLVIGCDSAAIELKKVIKLELDALDKDYEDVGVLPGEESVMYPLVAQRVVEKIAESGYTHEGILLCGTGIGMAITANKFPGIYAAVCHDIYSAERSRLSNDTNVITLGARVIGPELARSIIRRWLELSFVAGASTPKIEKIREFESRNFAQHAEGIMENELAQTL